MGRSRFNQPINLPKSKVSSRHRPDWQQVICNADKRQAQRLEAVRQAQRGNGQAAAHAAVEQVMGNDGGDYDRLCLDLLGQD